MIVSKHSFSSGGGGCAFSVESGTEPNKTVPDPVHGSSLDQATRPRGGPTATHHYGYRHSTPQAAHGRCRARNDMAATQVNVVIVDNDRGDSPSSDRAHALRADAQEVSRDTT